MTTPALPTAAQREPVWERFDHMQGCVWIGSIGKRGVGNRFWGAQHSQDGLALSSDISLDTWCLSKFSGDAASPCGPAVAVKPEADPDTASGVFSSGNKTKKGKPHA